MPQPPRPVSDTWKTVVHDSHAAGRLVYSMDQGNLIRMSNHSDADFSEGGVCYALVVRWLGMRRRGADYDQLFRGSRGFDHVTSVPDQVFTDQVNRMFDVEIYSGMGTNMPRGAMMGITQNLLLARHGLRVVGKQTWRPPFDVRDLVNYVAGTSALYLVSLYRAGGSHAVGIEVTGNAASYRFFDPNYGQFILRGSAAFVIFLQRFFADTGYGATYNVAMTARRIRSAG